VLPLGMLIDIARGYGGKSVSLFASSLQAYTVASQFLMDEFLCGFSYLYVRANKGGFRKKLLLEVASRDFHPTILRLGTLFGLFSPPTV